ncbi:transmembrane matrix receptor MUP-4-like isoform X6 [Hydra vulgaris]|uniref:Transmembrane matrix receptor MUP-4-like isoform X6 n=1 Tax=Hydra vulgaris TaxID=6087 RepID=A0ABM4DA23_HYDVU
MYKSLIVISLVLTLIYGKPITYDLCMFLQKCQANSKCEVFDGNKFTCKCLDGFEMVDNVCRIPNPPAPILLENSSPSVPNVLENSSPSAPTVLENSSPSAPTVSANPNPPALIDLCALLVCPVNSKCVMTIKNAAICVCGCGYYLYDGSCYKITADAIDHTDPCALLKCPTNSQCEISADNQASCQCLSGYSKDGQSCNIIKPDAIDSTELKNPNTPDPSDQCALLKCPTNSQCEISADNQASCQCLSGYSKDGQSCNIIKPDAIDSTELKNPNTPDPSDQCALLKCPTNSQCEISADNQASCQCLSGYSKDGQSCNIIKPDAIDSTELKNPNTPDPSDQCALLKCPTNSQCEISADNQASCQCLSGYSKDGQSCNIIKPDAIDSTELKNPNTPDPSDQCALLKCPTNSQCEISADNQASCQCLSGYSKDGQSCNIIKPDAIDSTELKNPNTPDPSDQCALLKCPTNSQCEISADNQASCQCLSGYSKDGQSCNIIKPDAIDSTELKNPNTPDPSDQCALLKCPTNSQCEISADNQASCQCLSGYSKDGQSCILENSSPSAPTVLENSSPSSSTVLENSSPSSSTVLEISIPSSSKYQNC